MASNFVNNIKKQTRNSYWCTSGCWKFRHSSTHITPLCELIPPPKIYIGWKRGICVSCLPFLPSHIFIKTFLYLQDSRQTLASRRKLLPVSPMIKPKALPCPSPLLDGENQVPGLHAFDVDAESGRKRWTIEPYRSRMLQALNLVGKGISKQKACNLCKVDGFDLR